MLYISDGINCFEKYLEEEMAKLEDTLLLPPTIFVEVGDKICLVPTSSSLGRIALKAFVLEYELKNKEEEVCQLRAQLKLRTAPSGSRR